jgi:hypothetical protein
MDNNKKILKEISILESKIDHLEAEIIYLNKALIKVGFDEGIKTLKESISEVLVAQSY